jgi:hypothetical protein
VEVEVEVEEDEEEKEGRWVNRCRVLRLGRAGPALGNGLGRMFYDPGWVQWAGTGR